MARKRYSDEDEINLLRQIELSLSSGSDVQSACRFAGVSDATGSLETAYTTIYFNELEKITHSVKFN